MKRNPFLPSIVAIALCSALVAHSETIVLSSGRSIAGTVIRTNGGDLMVVTDHGTYNFAKDNIKEIKGAQAEAGQIPITARIPDFRTVVLALSREKWGGDLAQIPATVIEKGAFRSVPYLSFRCSDDYEVNIYGDLKDPAAIEVGVYRKLLGDETAKNNCINFISTILGEQADRDILKRLSREKDLQVRSGVSFEITPSTAEDAYNGWWISIFSEQKLNRSRASEKELNEISISKGEAATPGKEGGNSPEWSPGELKLARPSQSDLISFVSPAGETITNAEVVRVVDNAYLIWRRDASGGMVRLADLPQDLRSRFGYDPTKAAASYASEDRRKVELAQERRLAAQSATTGTAPAQVAPVGYYPGGSDYSGYNSGYSGGGRVFVHGYTKRDGTYVSSHTRRR